MVIEYLSHWVMIGDCWANSVRLWKQPQPSIFFPSEVYIPHPCSVLSVLACALGHTCLMDWDNPHPEPHAFVHNNNPQLHQAQLRPCAWFPSERRSSTLDTDLHKETSPANKGMFTALWLLAILCKSFVCTICEWLLLHSVAVLERLPEALYSLLSGQLVSHPSDKPGHALWACVIQQKQKSQLPTKFPTHQKPHRFL